MNFTLRSIFFLKSVATGILMPVMSLMIMARGASLSVLPFVIGTYSLVVILLEFPSGVFCDLFGRKKTFVFSVSLMLFSFCFLLAGGPHVWVLFIAFAIQGAGRAFSSGSLDALVMQQSIQLGGDKAAARTSGDLGFLESTGIALGSIGAGFLGSIGDMYSVNLAVIVLCYSLILLLTIFGVKEAPVPDMDQSKENQSLKEQQNGFKKKEHLRPGIRQFGKQMKSSLSFAGRSKEVRFLLIQGFFTGVALLAAETYWQPGLLRLMEQKVIWLFGMVSFLGFGFTALASHLAPKLMAALSEKSSQIWWTCLFGTKMLFYLGIILMGCLVHPLFFICGYFFIYFVHGSGNIMENTLLTKSTPKEMLASVMSLFSLIFQSGALAASGLTSIILAKADLPVVWWSLGGLGLIGVCISFMTLTKRD